MAIVQLVIGIVAGVALLSYYDGKGKQQDKNNNKTN